MDTDDSGSIRQAALNAAGIAYQLRTTVTDFLADGRLVEVLPHLAMPALPAYPYMHSVASCRSAVVYSSTS
jgi:DNA-binding transcriptional LysR family regulator